MPKLAVQLVMYNEERYIPYLFYSLKKQTFQDWELLYLDNGSTDRTMEYVKKELETLKQSYRIFPLPDNKGFSAGHSILYGESTAPYVLLLNADMYLMPNVFEEIVKFLDTYKEVASVGPRLMRWDFEKVKLFSELEKDAVPSIVAREGFTNLIDALGIRLFRNRRAVEWLTQHEWRKDSESNEVRQIYNEKTLEVFGVSGALVCYRRDIIERVLLPVKQIFDPTYHSYKEDVDLAYRLRNAGYTSYVILQSVAWHDRTGAGAKEMTDKAALKNKKRHSFFVKTKSYKNHILTLYKNEYWQNFLLDFPFIFWYELKKFVYFLVFDTKVLIVAWRDLLQSFSYARSARRVILDSRKLYWKGIRRWIIK